MHLQNRQYSTVSLGPELKAQTTWVQIPDISLCEYSEPRIPTALSYSSALELLQRVTKLTYVST